MLDGSGAVFLEKLQALFGANRAFRAEMDIVKKVIPLRSNVLLRLRDPLVEVGDIILGSGGTRHTASAITLPIFMYVVLDGERRGSYGKQRDGKP